MTTTSRIPLDDKANHHRTLSLSNAGLRDKNLLRGDFDKALEYHQESLRQHELANHYVSLGDRLTYLRNHFDQAKETTQ